MSMASARTWGAVQSGVGNAGQSLIAELARQRALEAEAAELAMRGRAVGVQEEGNVIQRERLATEAAEARADRDLRAAIEGYAPATGAAHGGMPTGLLDGVQMGMGARSAANPGGALLRSLAPPAAAAPPTSYRANPENHIPTLAARENRTFVGTENAADRSNRVQVANIGEAGANARTAATIGAQERLAGGRDNPALETPAAFRASRLVQSYGQDVDGLLADLQALPPTRENGAVLAEVQKLLTDRNRRDFLDIGGGTSEEEILNRLGITPP